MHIIVTLINTSTWSLLMDRNLANPSLSTILISEEALVGLDKQVSKVALGHPTKIQLVLLKFMTPISFKDKCKYQTKTKFDCTSALWKRWTSWWEGILDDQHKHYQKESPISASSFSVFLPINFTVKESITNTKHEGQVVNFFLLSFSYRRAQNLIEIMKNWM